MQTLTHLNKDLLCRNPNSIECRQCTAHNIRLFKPLLIVDNVNFLEIQGYLFSSNLFSTYQNLKYQAKINTNWDKNTFLMTKTLSLSSDSLSTRNTTNYNLFNPNSKSNMFATRYRKFDYQESERIH